MATEPELLAREGNRHGRVGRTAAVLLLIAAGALAVTRFGGTSSVPPVTVTARTLDSSGNLLVHTVIAKGGSARRLARDVQALTPGRIECGAPGPAEVVLRFRDASYDVNGECARVVRLPERPGETVWLESAALHDDLAAILQR